jgi:hypothetical protein
MNTNARRLALSSRETAEGQDAFASSVSFDNQIRRLAVGITTSTSRYRRARRRPRQLLNSLDIFGGDLTGANVVFSNPHRVVAVRLGSEITFTR